MENVQVPRNEQKQNIKHNTLCDWVSASKSNVEVHYNNSKSLTSSLCLGEKWLNFVSNECQPPPGGHHFSHLVISTDTSASTNESTEWLDWSTLLPFGNRFDGLGRSHTFRFTDSSRSPDD